MQTVSQFFFFNFLLLLFLFFFLFPFFVLFAVRKDSRVRWSMALERMLTRSWDAWSRKASWACYFNWHLHCYRSFRGWAYLLTDGRDCAFYFFRSFSSLNRISPRSIEVRVRHFWCEGTALSRQSCVCCLSSMRYKLLTPCFLCHQATSINF